MPCCVVKPLEFGVCLDRALTQVGNVRPSAFGALGATIEHMRQKLPKTRRLQQTPLDVFRDQVVAFFHRNSAPGTAIAPWRVPVQQVQ